MICQCFNIYHSSIRTIAVQKSHLDRVLEAIDQWEDYGDAVEVERSALMTAVKDLENDRSQHGLPDYLPTIGAMIRQRNVGDTPLQFMYLVLIYHPTLAIGSGYSCLPECRSTAIFASNFGDHCPDIFCSPFHLLSCCGFQ